MVDFQSVERRLVRFKTAAEVANERFLILADQVDDERNSASQPLSDGSPLSHRHGNCRRLEAGLLNPTDQNAGLGVIMRAVKMNKPLGSCPNTTGN